MSQTTATNESTAQAAASTASTLCAAFQITAQAQPDDGVALRAHGHDGHVTWGEYRQRVEQIAGGLHALGVGRGDVVGVMMTNRPEFHLVDNAALHLGALPFSVYITSSPEQLEYLINHAENSVMVVEQVFVDRLAKADVPGLRHVVVVDVDDPSPAGGDFEVLTLAELESRAAADFDFEASWRAVDPTDVAALIYTSGTTGPPKGVELTHASLMFNLNAMFQRLPMPDEGGCVSYLPHAHMADRIVSHYLQMITGWSITDVADPTQVFAALPSCRPVWFLGVPRVWEKLRAALVKGFQDNPPEVRGAIERALELGTARFRAGTNGGELSAEEQAEWAAMDAAVLAPMRAKLGFDNASLLLSGAAPLASEVHEFFLAMGLPLMEGYGMSETGALGSSSPPDDIRLGTVGTAMPGTEVRIAEDGELLMRGQHVMRGYRKDPERNSEAIDEDGWLHTGDVATMDDDGFIRIVDRKKELIINASGKNMSPVNIESTLKNASPLIGQACVIGDRRRYNVALLVLDPDVAAAFAADKGIDATSVADIAADPVVAVAIDTAVEQANERLSRVEQIKKYVLLQDEWLPDGDELTATMKFKRRAIDHKYAATIDALYAEDDD